MWYRVGTVTLTNGSKVVTGNDGAIFENNVKVGNILMVADALLEVGRRTDVSTLELAVEYSGVSGTYPYTVINTIVGSSNYDTALKIDDFIADNQTILSAFTAWVNGPFDGGPGGDGIYPVVDRNGVVTMAKSPKRLAKDIEISIGQLGSASIPANEFPLEEYFEQVNTEFLAIRDAILGAGNLAEQWANAPVDQPVDSTGFSARHFATKALQYAIRAEAVNDNINSKHQAVIEKEGLIKLDRIAVSQDRTAVNGVKVSVEGTKGQVDSVQATIEQMKADIDAKYAAILAAASSLTSVTDVVLPATVVAASGAITLDPNKQIAAGMGMLLLQVSCTPSNPTTMYEIAIKSDDTVVYEAKGIYGAKFLDNFSVFAHTPGSLTVTLRNRGNAPLTLTAGFAYSSMVTP